MKNKLLALTILTLFVLSLIPNVIADEIIDGELEVWPGDTNNDGIVNDEDKNPITEFFGVTGTPRSDSGDISWKAHTAKPWENILATFADANGDGIVNQADVNVVGVNYGKKVGLSTENGIIETTIQIKDVLIYEEFQTIGVGYYAGNTYTIAGVSIPTNRFVSSNPYTTTTEVNTLDPNGLYRVKVELELLYPVIGSKVDYGSYVISVNGIPALQDSQEQSRFVASNVKAVIDSPNKHKFVIMISKKNNLPNNPPIISGVSGPQSLKVYETGTWTIKAYDVDGNYLSYKVDWGDYTVMASSSKNQVSSISAPQQTTFTHSYSTSGTYKVTFTVTDEKGASAVSSVTVIVGTVTTSCGNKKCEMGEAETCVIECSSELAYKVIMKSIGKYAFNFARKLYEDDTERLTNTYDAHYYNIGDNGIKVQVTIVEYKNKDAYASPSAEGFRNVYKKTNLNGNVIYSWNGNTFWTSKNFLVDIKEVRELSLPEDIVFEYLKLYPPDTELKNTDGRSYESIPITIPSRFTLSVGQSASAKNYQSLKITLKDVYANPECNPKENICPMGFAREYAIVTVSKSGNGVYNEYTLFEGESAEFLGVTLKLLDAKTTSADFSIIFGETLGQDYVSVYLNQEFDIHKEQTAVVKDYYDMRIKLNGISERCIAEPMPKNPSANAQPDIAVDPNYPVSSPSIPGGGGGGCYLFAELTIHSPKKYVEKIERDNNAEKSADVEEREAHVIDSPNKVISAPNERLEYIFVWPGDTNNDGTVNDNDKDAINKYFGYTGVVRATIWKPNLAKAWSNLMATYADANGDGIVSQADILVVGLNYGKTHGVHTNSEEKSLSDLVSINDYIIVWPGDANNDGIVDDKDNDVINKYFGYTGVARATLWTPHFAKAFDNVMATYADANGDGIVNEKDVLVVGLNYGRNHPISQQSSGGGSGGSAETVTATITGSAVSSASASVSVAVPSTTQTVSKKLYSPRNIRLIAGESAYLYGAIITLLELNSYKAVLIVSVNPDNFQGGEIGEVGQSAIIYHEYEEISQEQEAIKQETEFPPQPKILTTKSFSKECNNGCKTDSKCLTYGTRIVENNIPKFCEVNGEFIEQKEKSAECQNNYECKTNQCNDGVCGSLQEELRETRGLLESILKWFGSVFREKG